MAAETFQGNMETIFKGMEEFISTKTVVGQPVTVGDTVILPFVDVSFGAAASAKAEPQRHGGGGGLGGKMSPSALLVIQDGRTRLINIKNTDTVTKLMDLVPEVMNRLKKEDPQVKAAADQAKEDASETF